MSSRIRKRVLSITVFLMVGFFGILICGLIYANFLPDIYCQTVSRVAVYDETAYLLTLDLEANYRRYASEDMGDTWNFVRDVPKQIQNDLTYPNPEPLPSKICDPMSLRHCYRISNTSNNLVESQDAGQSWNQLTIPLRLKSKPSCEEPKPANMVFVTDSNRSVLIIGMGTGGVILRSADGNWSYRGIDELR